MDRYHERNPRTNRAPVKGDSGLVDYGGTPVIAELTDVQAIAASNTYIHAAVTDNGTTQTITTGFTQPPAGTARPITVTSGGTNTDIKGGVQHTVYGTDLAGNAINDMTAAWTADTAGTKSTSLAFATVNKIIQPAHDGTGATFSYGIGNGFGLRQMYARNSVLGATLNGVRETTFPTVAFSATVLAANIVTLNSSLNGTPVAVFLLA